MMTFAPLAAEADDWKSCASIATGATTILEFVEQGAAAALDIGSAMQRWKRLAPKYRESKIALSTWAHQHHRSHAYVSSVLAKYVPTTAPFVRQRSIDASRYTDELGRRLRQDITAAVTVAATLEDVGSVSRSVVAIRCPHTRRVREDLRVAGISSATWSKSARMWTLDPRSNVKLRSCTEEQVDTFVYVLCRRGWQASKSMEDER